MALALMVDGVDRISDLVHESLYIIQSRDGLNSTCTFDIHDAGVIQAGAWTVEVTRVEDGDVITGYTNFSEPKVEVSVVDGATVYFAGILSRITVRTMGQILIGDRQQPEIQVLCCACHDFNQMLEESIIDSLEEYVSKTDEQIIDDLFPKYVTGIDFATNVIGPFVSDVISFENISVRHALDILSAKSQYVWYVDYAEKLWYKAAGADAPAWHLSDIPDDINSFSYLARPIRESDATNLVNRVFVVGASASNWYEDAVSMALYGVHSFIVRDAQLVDADDIEARADAILDRFKDPIVTYEVRTQKDGLRAGMRVRFVCAYYDVDAEFLISQLIVTFPDDREPIYELTLGGLETSGGAAAHRITLDKVNDLPAIIPSQLPLASRGWGHDLTFTATDDDTVAWGVGTLTTASGQTFAIGAGDTDDPGAMVAKTIVYLDTAISLTALQMTTDETAAIGYGRIMVAVAWPSGIATVDAGFQVFGATGELATYLNATNVIANSITANEIFGNTLSVIAADMGTLTAGVINITGGGAFGRILLSVGGIALYDVADNQRMWLNANDGTLHFSSAEAGNPRIEIGSTEIAGYDGADIKQFYLNAADGVAYAGAGDVKLDADGICIVMGAVDNKNKIKFTDTGTVRSEIFAHASALQSTLLLRGGPPRDVGDYARVSIQAEAAGALADTLIYVISERTAAKGQIRFEVQGSDRVDIYETYTKVADDLRIGKGLYVGQTGVNPDDDDVWCDGEISTDGGTFRWDLENYHLGAPTIEGYVKLYINGNEYRLAAEKI